MKVILTEDIKGKGKKHQTIDVAAGYGNFLIKEKKAVIANKENEENLKAQLTLEFEKEVLKMLEAQDLKNRLEEKKEFNFVVEPYPDGSPCNAITKKDLLKELKHSFGDDVKIDSKMIKMDKPIRQFGCHEVEINLYPDVVAKVIVNISVTMVDKG